VTQRVRYKRSDLGNAERLVDGHGDDLRFCPGVGWLEWDGRRWQRDTDGDAMRRMKRTVRAIYSETGRIDDPDERTALYKFALRSEGGSRLAAALQLAETEARLVVGADQLDADPVAVDGREWFGRPAHRTLAGPSTR
jgi:putative DNA primase/helicase